MNPLKYAQMMKYLTRAKKAKPDLPDVFPASKAPIPPKTQNVEEIEAINAFIRRERQQKAGGGMLVQPGFGGTRQGYSGDDGDYIYTRESGAKRLVIGDTNYGQVAKGDKKGLEALKKKRDKLVASGKFNLRTKYDLELLKNQWRKTLPTKKATTWENFLKTKFPKNSTTPNTIRKKTETDFREGTSDFNPKEEYKINVKEKQNLKKVEQAIKLVEAHKNSDKFLYDKKTIFKKLGFSNVPQVFKKETSTGKVYKSLINEAIVNEVEKLMPIEQKIINAFDKIVNENLKIYEPKGGSKERAGIIKKMISDIVSPKGGLEKYQVSSRLINNVLSTHQPYLDIKNDFDYLEQNLARKMKGNTFNEAMDYAKYVRGGLEMKNIEKLSRNFLLPESNVMRFALRSAFNNYKAKNTDPPVKVFNLKADGTPGKPVDFGKLKIDYSTNMRKIDINKIGFTYDGEFFTKNNIRTKGLQSGLFDEVYKLTAKGNMPVPDPNNPNKNITLNKLLQLNKDKLTLGHNDAKGGVTKLPFSDLRLEGNKINLALYNAYNKIKNKSLRKLVVNKLQGDFGFLKGADYEKAFIEGEQNKATNIAKKKINEFPIYKQAGRDVITDLGQDFLKQKESFQTEAFRVAGIGKKEEQTILNNLQAKSKLKECKIPAADGGRIGFANSIKCIEDGLNETRKAAAAGDQKAARQLVETAEAASKGGRLLKNVLGPGAILGEALFEGALIGNRLLEGKPLKQAWAESYLSYLDPRKYSGELDPTLLQREQMLESTADKNILRSGFAAQDQLSAFNKALQDRELAKARGRTDQYNVAAADAREQGRFADQSADIISSEAFKDASRVAQEYLQGQTGANIAKYRTDDFGRFESGRDRDLRRRRMQEMSNIMPRDFLTEKTSDLLNRTQALRELGYDVSTRDLMAQQEALRSIPLSQAAEMYSPEQVYGTQGEFAGGGIAKLAGVDQGPPPERGPNSQGLLSLKNRVRNL